MSFKSLKLLSARTLPFSALLLMPFFWSGDVAMAITSPIQLQQKDEAPPQEKTVAPGAAEQKKIKKLIRELYAKEYKLRDPFEKLAFAKQLLQDAEAAKQKTDERFMLTVEAISIASSLGESGVVETGLIALRNGFEFDFWSMAEPVADTIYRKSKQPLQRDSTADFLELFAELAVEDEQFDIAKSAIRKSALLSKKLGDAEEQKRKEELQSAYAEIEIAIADAKKALAELADQPDDPKLNAAYGDYLAFVKQDFEGAMKYWAKSGDDVKKSIVDLARNKKTSAVDLAMKWDDLAKDQTGIPKRNVLAHVFKLFQNALPNLEGIEKRLAEKRIKELDGVVNRFDKKPGPKAVDKDADAAIEMGLAWIVAHQLPDGGWSLNHQLGPGNRASPDPGEMESARIAATGLALIPLLNAGNTHKGGAYKKEVAAGLNFLIKNGKSANIGSGNLGLSFSETDGTLYSHALGTMAIARAAELTQNRELKAQTNRALAYTLFAQDPIGGGWRYRPKEPGDVSATGWQVSAIEMAAEAGITVRKETMANCGRFLDSVSKDGMFGYTSPPTSRSMRSNRIRTCIGMLCQLIIEAGNEDSEVFQDNVKALLEIGPDVNRSPSIYFNYYGTRFFQKVGEESWEQWRKKLKPFLLESQSKDGLTKGTWFYTGSGMTESKTGRLGITCLTLMMLQEMQE